MELVRGTSSGSDEFLDGAIGRDGLCDADARLATALVLSVLRHQMWLDARYRPFLKLSPSRLSHELRTILRLAAAQRLLFDRIPEHAIANESTALAREVMRLPARDVAFANAVARRIAAMKAVPPVPVVPGDATPATLLDLSINTSHPIWLVEFLVGKYGLAEACGILQANNQEAPAVVRANRLRVSRDELYAEFARLDIACRPGALAPDSVILDSAATLSEALRSDLFLRGLFYVQDEASQLVSVIASPKAGERVLDLCAAPGGKATHMAEIAGGAASITATDVSARRLGTVRENVARLGTPSLETMEIEDVRARGQRYDLVLVDAPCSGLGTIRRNPEIRYRIAAEALERLAAQQLAILCEAARFVEPGGRIVYSTCSISDVENVAVIRAFLETNPEFEIAAAPALLPSLSELRRSDGFYRTWPRHLEMDGFEVAVLARMCPSR
jgi:16S rRNA (cytosine967-C5)-methyltransferase